MFSCKNMLQNSLITFKAVVKSGFSPKNSVYDIGHHRKKRKTKEEWERRGRITRVQISLDANQIKLIQSN